MSTESILRILNEPWAITLVILLFGASIFVHELGHYLAARWRGLVIERFSIGFGPRLFGWKDRHGVDWRVSLIPLGGYVALPQLADLALIEGRADAAADAARKPLSYTDKMIVAGAGAVFNVLFALAIGCVLWLVGLDVPEELETTRIGLVSERLIDADGMERDGPAARAGLRPGDEIVAIDGRPVNSWEDLQYAVATGTGRSPHGNPQAVLTIRRAGTHSDYTLFPVLDQFEGMRRIGLAPARTLIVGDTMENSPARRAGLQPGDRIVTANGLPLYHNATLNRLVETSADQPIALELDRAGTRLQLNLTPERVVFNRAGDTMPMLGVRFVSVLQRRHVQPLSHIGDAFALTFRVLGSLFHPGSDVGVSNLSGPVGIGYAIYMIAQISIPDVLALILLINVNLAILNLLPIPVLDGGHMVFATFAKVRGKPVPAGLIGFAQSAFLLLFLTLFVVVTVFDVGRVRRNERAVNEAESAARQRVPIVFRGDPAPPAGEAAPAP
jgi:regulator of sigma E protease